jgi:uncharacterized membrane protein
MEKVLLWYGVSSLILGVLLYFPMRRFIYAISINRLQRKNNREATEREKAEIRKKANLIAAVISITFAFFYNRVLLSRYFTGG